MNSPQQLSTAIPAGPSQRRPQAWHPVGRRRTSGLLLGSLSAVLFGLLLAACATPTPAPPDVSPLPPTPSATETPTATHTPTPPAPTATLAPVAGKTQAQVNVRAGPGTGNPSLGLIDPGQTVQIIAQDPGGEWYLILYPAGPQGRGWVTSKFVQVTQGAQVPTITPQTQATPAGPTGTVTVKVNVRGGPGTEYPSLGMLSAQTVVTLTGKNATGSWLQIDYPSAAGGRGWIAAAYVQVQDTAGLPVLDNFGNPVTPAAGTGTPVPAGLPTATVGPAPDDGDSASNPAVRVTFSPVGTRQFSYSSQVSTPQGDSEDWIEFTPYTARAGDPAHLVVTLACSGNGSLEVELWQGGSPLSGWGTLQCGDANRSLSLAPGGTYQFRLQVAAGDGLQLVAYRLTVRDEP